MGLVRLQHVIRCSSQDPAHKADNLMDDSRRKPWLSDPMLRSGYIEAEFKLDSETHIDFIDIGNHGSSTFEVQVGKYSTHQYTVYQSFLPAMTLLELSDIKAGKALCSIFMFGKNNLNSDAVEKTWDCIKVICCQPYKKQMQFGLSCLSIRTKESPSILNIDNNCNVNKIYDSTSAVVSQEVEKQKKRSDSKQNSTQTKMGFTRFPKYLHGNSPLDPKAVMTRGKRILNASKFQVSASRKKSTGLINSFKTDADNFFIACIGDVERKLGDYLKDFELQRQQTLSLQEKKIFCDSFKDIFNNNTQKNELSLTDENNPHDLVKPSFISIDEKVPSNPRKHTELSSMTADQVTNNTQKNELSLTDENNPHDMVEPSLISVGEKYVEEFNSFTFNEKMPPNPRKRTASSSMVADHMTKFSIFWDTKNKPPYSTDLQDSEQGKKESIFAKFLGKSSTSAVVSQEVEKQKKWLDSRKYPTQTKMAFTRPEDFIQPDGIQPSTSSGITFVDCPVCRESFMTSEIEQHASTCGEPPTISSNESNPVVGLSDEEVTCPMCARRFHPNVIEFHVDQCLNLSSRRFK